MANEKCGVYKITCAVSGKCYVGSSCQIYRRWYEHRYELRAGKHRSPRLQRAWIKHGQEKFVFSVLEECSRDELFACEQRHINWLKPDYNSMLEVRVISKEMRAKINAAMKAKATLRTHCRNGHQYTPENTYRSPGRGDRRCVQCNRDRTNKIVAAMTAEQRKARGEKLYAARRIKFGMAERNSPEHIAKIVAKNRGRKINAEAVIRSAEVRAAKTHCKNGHEYAVVGVVTYNGCRGCKACRLEAKRRYNATLKVA